MNLTSRFGPLGSAIKKELYIELRYPLNFLFGIMMMFFIGVYFVFAAIAFSDPNASQATFTNVVFYSIWGLILFWFMSEIMWTVANFVRREQIQGTLEQLFLSSSSPQIVLLGGGIGKIVISLITGIIIVLSFSLVIRIPLLNILMGMWVMLVTLFMLLGLSLIFGAVILGMKRVNGILNFAQLIFMLICCVFFPFSVLPPELLLISKLIPVSYAVDMFRNTLIGLQPELISDMVLFNITFSGYWAEFFFLHLFAIFSFIIGWRFYNNQQNKKRKQEGLSHY